MLSQKCFSIAGSLSLLLMAFGFLGCTQRGHDSSTLLQKRIDSLEANAYKPGLGEFMSSIQIHHAKLWFAGENQNWELAGFEMGEINESLADIKKFCSNRPEIKSLVMIDQPLQQVNRAIEMKNLAAFKTRFSVLTSTCNNCHRETQHGYNIITIPDTPPFGNQQFMLKAGN